MANEAEVSDPGLLEKFLEFNNTYRAGDIASVLGLMITMVGFAATLYQVTRSRQAAEEARDHVLELNAVHGLSAAIRAFEDIRRLHRSEAWGALPDRYTSLRLELVAIRQRTPGLSAEHQKSIQGVVQQLSTMERQVERILEGTSEPEIARLNSVVTRQIDRLGNLLVELQKKIEG